MSSEKQIRVSLEDLQKLLRLCLIPRGFDHERARRCASIFAENDLVGVSSHGINRFPRFLEWIDRGWVSPKQIPERIASFGSVERWDGRLGAGPLNAEDAMSRTMEIAAPQGVGVVALRNTNHWMRAGTYATQAADAGFIGICFTNTEPNLPPWGSAEPKLGNNPLAVAIPRRDRHHVLFDGAMSQFSYGALEIAARAGKRLPVPGGFTADGRMTDAPGEILATRRAAPIGFWKGAGLSLILDLLASTLGDGRTTSDLGRQPGEFGVSQVFIAFAHSFVDASALDRIERVLTDLHAATDENGAPTRYPGERLFAARAENLRCGIPVEESIWDEVGRLAAVPPFDEE